MYLEHFGLSEPPFKITPVTEFFFSGANRGEILDALIYSISEVEGIVKVTGEVGSGKTMLCRMLLEKLPGHIETIYLANPSLSREEMLYAIADGLGLNIKGERVGIIMQNIQNRLEEKAHEGKRVVVLVDEAHAMPLDTLEELRLLYNLQLGNAKLLQLILFGQPELDAKLGQPNMRQLKDRIVHQFNMRPLSRGNLESYLMYRMRAAKYHGPNIFSPRAIKLMIGASSGLMRRVNVLADKSLLAAFIENTHSIEARHVLAAIRDSDLKPSGALHGKELLAGGAVAALALIGLAAWWVLDPQQSPSAPSTPALITAESPERAPDDSSIRPMNPPAPASQPLVSAAQPATKPAAAQPVTALAPMPAAAPAIDTPAAPEKRPPKTGKPAPAGAQTGIPPRNDVAGGPAAVSPKPAQEPRRAEGALPPASSTQLPPTPAAKSPFEEHASSSPAAAGAGSDLSAAEATLRNNPAQPASPQ